MAFLSHFSIKLVAGIIIFVILSDKSDALSSYYIKTVTGLGLSGGTGFMGENIASTSSTLNYPSGVWVSTSGDAFISDSGNCRIRKVSDGIISTVAGSGGVSSGGDNGRATSVGLLFPVAVWLSPNGFMYISESTGYCCQLSILND